MAEQQETRRNRNADTSTEGPIPAAFTRQKLPARFVEDVSKISAYPNGACRLHILTCTTDETGQPLRIDTGLNLSCATLSTLAEALPEALAIGRGVSGSTRLHLHCGHHPHSGKREGCPDVKHGLRLEHGRQHCPFSC